MISVIEGVRVSSLDSSRTRYIGIDFSFSYLWNFVPFPQFKKEERMGTCAYSPIYV